MNGFERSRDDAGRESVVDARAVCDPSICDDPDAVGDVGDPRLLDGKFPEAGAGEATREEDGVLAGVVPVLLFNSNAGGTHPDRAPKEPLEYPD